MAGIGATVALIKALAPKADPAVIQQAVEDYLEAHPEISVADGSITEEKLAEDVAGILDDLQDDVSDVKTAIHGISQIDEAFINNRVNLFDRFNIHPNFYVGYSNGAFVYEALNTYTTCLKLIPIKAGDTLSVTKKGTTRIACFQSDKATPCTSVQTVIINESNNYQYTFTDPTTAYIMIAVKTSEVSLTEYIANYGTVLFEYQEVRDAIAEALYEGCGLTPLTGASTENGVQYNYAGEPDNTYDTFSATKYAVTPGDSLIVIARLGGGYKVTGRTVVFLDSSNNLIGDTYLAPNNAVTVPAGATQMVVSYRNKYDPIVFKIGDMVLTCPVLNNVDLNDNGNVIAFGIDSKSKKGYSIIVNGNITANFNKLTVRRSGEYHNAVINIFPTYFEVKNENLKFCDQAVADVTINHELTITSMLSVVIHVSEEGTAKMILSTETESKTFDINFFGGSYARVNSAGYKVNYAAIQFEMYDKPIRLYGDSYCGTLDPARWPRQLAIMGISEIYVNQQSGGASGSLYPQFMNDLATGIPKMVIWALGMNDSTLDVYQRFAENVLTVCDALRITPVLVTIPNVQTINNITKNAFIRSSGYKYIEMCGAVNTAIDSNTWKDGMLSSDGVHTTQRGAIQLALTAMHDCPELTQQS